jgi:hypothetical protein
MGRPLRFYLRMPSKRVIAAIVVLLLLAVAGGLYYAKTRLPDFATLYVRNELGLPDAVIGAASVSPKGMVLRDVSIDNAKTNKVAEIRITQKEFAPDTITITGADITVTLSKSDGLWYAGVDGLPASFSINGAGNPERPKRALTLPANAITIQDSIIRLVTPWGAAPLSVNGDLIAKQDGIHITQTIAGMDETVGGTYTLTGLYAESRAYEFDLKGTDLMLATTAASMKGGTMDGKIVKPVQSPAQLTGTLTADSLTQGRTTFEKVDAALTGTSDAPDVKITATMPANPNGRVPALAIKADGKKAGSKLNGNAVISTGGKKIGTLDLAYDLTKPDMAVLTVQTLNLALLDELTGWNGLAATGALQGKLPLRRTKENGWRVTSGRLSGAEGGTLSYLPEIYPGFLAGDDQRMASVREILKQLNITSLEVNASGDVMDEMKLQLKVKGKNPEFSPRPVHLNLQVEGAVFPLVQSLLQPLSLVPILDEDKKD